MKKSFTLLLMFAQLLIGGGIPAFACISKDGSYKVVAGSSFCTVCQSHNDDDDHSCDEIEVDHNHGIFLVDQSNLSHETILTSESCGCKHVPGMLVSDASTRTARIVFSIDLEQMTFMVLPWSAISSLPLLERQTSSLKEMPSVTNDIAIFVLSTIVIRC